MLCRFSVKNFKRIRDEVIFDMQAVAISEHEDRIIIDKDEEKILLQKKITVEPFAFSESKDESTECELFFRTTASEYRYILYVKRDIVLYESLDRVKLETGRKSALFTRNENGIVLKGAFANLKVSDELSKTLTLRSYLGIVYKGNAVVKDVLSWFEYGIEILNYENSEQELRMAVFTSEDVKQLMLQMILEMDLDIIDFRVEEKGNGRVDIFTKHRVDGWETEINLFDESSGTQKLFGLLPFIAESLLAGKGIVIDELDAKIHPVLLRHIIMMFNDMSINKHKAQLIFTSHDLSTMNSEVFRRDEIWFVAKGNAQNSKFYSLIEFKNENGESVRKDAKFDKQYLEGKYGADPYLRRIIDWGKVNA